MGHWTITLDGFISIHAPLTGSDRDLWRDHRYAVHFNPRSPYGERLVLPCNVGDTVWHFNPRSPYGERLQWHNLLESIFLFQSTLPLRGATEGILFRLVLLAISIHAPLTGSDRLSHCSKRLPDISIHAPLTGSDLPSLPMVPPPFDFNPRSPYGERQ